MGAFWLGTAIGAGNRLHENALQEVQQNSLMAKQLHEQFLKMSEGMVDEGKQKYTGLSLRALHLDPKEKNFSKDLDKLMQEAGDFTVESTRKYVTGQPATPSYPEKQVPPAPLMGAPTQTSLQPSATIPQDVLQTLPGAPVMPGVGMGETPGTGSARTIPAVQGQEATPPHEEQVAPYQRSVYPTETEKGIQKLMGLIPQLKLQQEFGLETFGKEKAIEHRYATEELITKAALTPPKDLGDWEKKLEDMAQSRYGMSYANLPKPTKEEVMRLAADLTTSAADKAGQDLARELAAARLADAQQKLADARQRKADVQEYVSMINDSPDIFHDLTPTEKVSVGGEWRRQTGLPVPKRLPESAKTTESNAEIALEHLNNIRTILRDPAVYARIGPVLGRMGEVEMKVGATTGLTPEQAQKAQDLRTSMFYFFTREGRALISGRVAIQFLDMLKEVSPRPSMVAEMINGALDAMERSTKSAIMSVEKQRFGGKTRPGFTPGFVGGGGSNSAVDDFFNSLPPKGQ